MATKRRKKKKTGRPPLADPALVKSTGIYVALSPAEKAAYIEAAEQDGARSPGHWLRGLAAARLREIEQE